MSYFCWELADPRFQKPDVPQMVNRDFAIPTMLSTSEGKVSGIIFRWPVAAGGSSLVRRMEQKAPFIFERNALPPGTGIWVEPDNKATGEG